MSSVTHESKALAIHKPSGGLFGRFHPTTARLLRVLVGALAGAGLGLSYYALIGCSSGTCPITSHPLSSALYGALMGGFVAFR